MALDVLVTSNRLKSDPAGRDLVQFLTDNSDRLDLEEAALYYDFPTYADYDTVTHKPDALLLSPVHGVLAIRIGLENQRAQWAAYDESLGQFASHLIGRLLKSKILRRDRSSIRFDVVPVLYFPGGKAPKDAPESEVATSHAGLEKVLESLQEKQDRALTAEELAEARSVIEGAKALTRPQKRVVDNPERTPLSASFAALESEIANCDEQHTRGIPDDPVGSSRLQSRSNVSVRARGKGVPPVPSSLCSFTHWASAARQVVCDPPAHAVRIHVGNLEASIPAAMAGVG
jgi:hypothetical protein